jgi:hypothetical protein
MKRYLYPAITTLGLFVWSSLASATAFGQTTSPQPLNLPKPSAADIGKTLLFTRYDMKPEKAIAESDQLLHRLGLAHERQPSRVRVTYSTNQERVVEVEWPAKLPEEADPRYVADFDSLHGLLVHFMNYAAFYHQVKGYGDNRRDRIETDRQARWLLLQYARCLEPSLPKNADVVLLWMHPPRSGMSKDAIEGSVGLPFPGGYAFGTTDIARTYGIPLIEMTLSRHTGALVEASVGYPPAPGSLRIDPPVVHITKDQAAKSALEALKQAITQGHTFIRTAPPGGRVPPRNVIQPGTSELTITRMNLCYAAVERSPHRFRLHLCWVVDFDQIVHGKPVPLNALQYTTEVDVDAATGRVMLIEWPVPFFIPLK